EFADCCDNRIRPARYLPSTMFPTTLISTEARSPNPLPTASLQLIVFAGNCKTRLHGTSIVIPFTFTVPPGVWLTAFGNPERLSPPAASHDEALSTLEAWM